MPAAAVPGVRFQIDRVTGRPLLLFPEAVLELQGSGSAIVPLCDGERTLSEIIANLLRQFQAPEAVLRADVSRYLCRLHERMLVQFDESSAREPIVPGGTVSVTTAASSCADIRTSLTASDGAARRGELSLSPALSVLLKPGARFFGSRATTETWQRVLIEAGEMGVFHALFSGGEPLVRSDLEDLIVIARESGLYTNLITSAIGFTRERARSLKQAGLDSVQISFQSDQTDLADSIAGASTHSRKLEAAAIVRDLGFPLTINVVLHRFNIDRVEAVIALAEDLGRGGWS